MIEPKYAYDVDEFDVTLDIIHMELVPCRTFQLCLIVMHSICRLSLYCIVYDIWYSSRRYVDVTLFYICILRNRDVASNPMQIRWM